MPLFVATSYNGAVNHGGSHLPLTIGEQISNELKLCLSQSLNLARFH